MNARQCCASALGVLCARVKAQAGHADLWGLRFLLLPEEESAGNSAEGIQGTLPAFRDMTQDSSIRKLDKEQLDYFHCPLRLKCKTSLHFSEWPEKLVPLVL